MEGFEKNERRLLEEEKKSCSRQSSDVGWGHIRRLGEGWWKPGRWCDLHSRATCSQLRHKPGAAQKAEAGLPEGLCWSGKCRYEFTSIDTLAVF